MNQQAQYKTATSQADTPNPWVSPPPSLTLIGEYGPTTLSRPADTDTPIYHYAIQRAPGVVKGTPSRMRNGFLRLSREGIHIDGKAVLNQDTQAICFLLGLLFGIGVLLVALCLENYRQPRQEYISWEEVEEIILDSQKNKICFVYPDRDKFSRSCSLVLEYKDERLYQSITHSARHFVPNKVHEGKIKRPDMVAAWVALGVIIFMFVLACLAATPHK
jgi:hypothetical protein